MKRVISDAELIKIRDILIKANPGKIISSEHIRKTIKDSLNVDVDASTIRGRFIQMGQSLSGKADESVPPELAPKDDPLNVTLPEPTKKQVIPEEKIVVPDDLAQYLLNGVMFDNYIQRPVDKLLAVHLDLG